MVQKYFRLFLSPYEGRDYLLLARARLLLIFETVFIFLIVLVPFSMLFAGWEDFIKTLAIIPVLFIGFSISLWALKKGNYDLSAGILISFATVRVVGGLFFMLRFENRLSAGLHPADR